VMFATGYRSMSRLYLDQMLMKWINWMLTKITI
jgi:hypothetical protein